MNAGTIFVRGAETRTHRELLEQLEKQGFELSRELPDRSDSPTIVLTGSADPGALDGWSQQRYCLVIAPEPFFGALPEHISWLGAAEARAHSFRSVRDWIGWAQLDAGEPLREQQLLGRSPSFCRLITGLRSAARFEAPVLLKGETGTGKEVAARALHRWSARHERPFIPINCGGQNDDLLASELFGYERGAFTDAKERRTGLIAQAEGGTLFLDEVNSLSAKSQARLLRFLQDQSYRPLGSRRSEKADVRIVAASNQPLRALVQEGAFRQDLYYRLEVLSIELPALRERRQDIPVLARHFLRLLNLRYGLSRAPKSLHPETLAWFQEYRWPGNVRELENTLHRLFALAEGEVLSSSAAHAVGSEPAASTPASEVLDEAFPPFQHAKSAAIACFERSYLERLLRACAGNISLAARRAGKERRTFGRLLRKYGLGSEQSSGSLLES